MSGNNKQQNEISILSLWEESSDDDFDSSDDDVSEKAYTPLADSILQRNSYTYSSGEKRSRKSAYFTGQKRKRRKEEEEEEVASTTSSTKSSALEDSQSDDDADDDDSSHDRRLTSQQSPRMLDDDEEEQEPIDSLPVPFSDTESNVGEEPVFSTEVQHRSDRDPTRGKVFDQVDHIESTGTAPNSNSLSIDVDVVARQRHQTANVEASATLDAEEPSISKQRDTSTTAKRKRDTSINRSLDGHKRVCYGSRNGIGKLPESKSFYIDDSAPYLSIVEGIEARDPWHREDFGEEYLRNMLQEARPTLSSGHAMEMPVEASTGNWTAEIERDSDSSARNASLMSPDHLRNFRLRLRHESCSKLKSLTSNSTQNARVEKLSLSLEISVFRPRLFRKASIEVQRVVDLTKNPYSFIGSLSFTCLASDVFDDEPTRRSPTNLDFATQPSPTCPSETQLLLGLSRPEELSMTSNWMSKKNWGVSFLCSLGLDSDYHLLYAQDTSGKNPKIVAIDVIFESQNSSQKQSCDDGSSSSTTHAPPELTENALHSLPYSTKMSPFNMLRRLFGVSLADDTNKNKQENETKSTESTICVSGEDRLEETGQPSEKVSKPSMAPSHLALPKENDKTGPRSALSHQSPNANRLRIPNNSNGKATSKADDSPKENHSIASNKIQNPDNSTKFPPMQDSTCNTGSTFNDVPTVLNHSLTTNGKLEKHVVNPVDLVGEASSIVPITVTPHELIRAKCAQSKNPALVTNIKDGNSNGRDQLSDLRPSISGRGLAKSDNSSRRLFPDIDRENPLLESQNPSKSKSGAEFEKKSGDSTSQKHRQWQKDRDAKEAQQKILDSSKVHSKASRKGSGCDLTPPQHDSLFRTDAPRRHTSVSLPVPDAVRKSRNCETMNCEATMASKDKAYRLAPRKDDREDQQSQQAEQQASTIMTQNDIATKHGTAALNSTKTPSLKIENSISKPVVPITNALATEAAGQRKKQTGNGRSKLSKAKSLRVGRRKGANQASRKPPATKKKPSSLLETGTSTSRPPSQKLANTVGDSRKVLKKATKRTMAPASSTSVKTPKQALTRRKPVNGKVTAKKDGPVTNVCTKQSKPDTPPTGGIGTEPGAILNSSILAPPHQEANMGVVVAPRATSRSGSPIPSVRKMHFWRRLFLVLFQLVMLTMEPALESLMLTVPLGQFRSFILNVPVQKRRNLSIPSVVASSLPSLERSKLLCSSIGIKIVESNISIGRGLFLSPSTASANEHQTEADDGDDDGDIESSSWVKSIFYPLSAK